MRKPINAERLKSAIPPADFYRVELPTMPPPKAESGWMDGGLCPFHPDKHSGNFRVNADTGAFRCFACGVAGGDIIAFAERHYGLAFADALAALADAWGVSA